MNEKVSKPTLKLFYLGDIVYFKKPWDEHIKMNDIEYYVLSESEIILIEK